MGLPLTYSPSVRGFLSKPIGKIKPLRPAPTGLSSQVVSHDVLYRLCQPSLQLRGQARKRARGAFKRRSAPACGRAFRSIQRAVKVWPGSGVLSAVAARAPHVGVQGRTDRSGVRGQAPHAWERSRPRLASRLDASRVAGDRRAMATLSAGQAGTSSRNGVPVRHIACRITASFRARATLALRGPVRSAIARAQSRRRDPPSCAS